LDTDAKDFETELKVIARDLNATLALDCVGGNMVGTLFKCLSRNGVVVSYGTLSDEPIGGIDAADLRFGDKKLIGFFAEDWIQRLEEKEREEVYEFIKMNLGTVFRTHIVDGVEMNGFKDALK